MARIAEIDRYRLDRLHRVNDRVQQQERTGRHDFAKSVRIVHRWIRRYYLATPVWAEPTPTVEDMLRERAPHHILY